MEFKLINFKKYDYNPDSCGELIASAECKYNNFHCITEIVTCVGEPGSHNFKIKSKNTYWHGKNKYYGEIYEGILNGDVEHFIQFCIRAKYNTHRRGKKI